MRIVVALGVLACTGAARAGPPLPPGVVHPILWNAASNVASVDEAPGLSTGFTVSSAVFDADIPEDAFGNADGAVEPDTFIFGEGTADNDNLVLGDGGETVDFIQWQTTSPTTVLGYELVLGQLDPFGREAELVRFLVDGVERDFFDNDSATGVDNSTILHVLRPFGTLVTGSTFRIEVTRAGIGPRITEINALTESFCGNATTEGAEECDDGNTAAGDGCDAACLEESSSPCAVAPILACVNAGKASLSVLESKPGKEKLKLALKKLADSVPLADLGDPVGGTTRYDVCLYGDADQLVAELSVDRAGQSCGGKPCWKAAGGVGFKYKDAGASASGVSKLSLKSGEAGKGALSLQAGNRADRGQSALPTGIAAALQGALAATVQVHSDAPACFAAELGTVKQAGPDRFQASAP